MNCLRLTFLSLLPGLAALADYQHFEARQVHPLAMTPDGSRLVAVDSANARVTVFSLAGAQPSVESIIPTGLEPASVRLRTQDEAWVVNEAGDNISIISLSGGVVLDTLTVGDEPTDVAFAAGKAFVACARDNQIRVYDAVTRAPAGVISLQGLYPHALAVNAAGTRLYAAFLLSGNRTTVIKKEAAPAPPAPTNAALPAAPSTALIVPASDARVPNIILDQDVAEIDTATLGVVRYISDVGTNLFDVAVRPGADDEVWVANTDALNAVRFEPALRGHFAHSRLSVITPGAVQAVDLNPGLDYGLLPNPAAQASALAQPTSLAFSTDGAELWVAAFASDRIALVDAESGSVLGRVDLRTGQDTTSAAMRGPRGLALDEARGRLYALNKLSRGITVVNTTTLAVEAELPLAGHDPMPRAVREGRGYLFDARLSGNGTVSCGICHMDADRDGLAWDLGDPGGEMLTVLGANLSVHDTTPRPRTMHPMKGPMVTQTLRGMQNGAPFHWRGDKPTLQSFNSTFDNLMGGSQIPADDMDDLATYLKSLVHHSNPNRNLDRSLPTNFAGGNPVTGRTLYNNHTKSHCAVCHLLPEGSDHNIDLPQEAGLSQPVKTPPLRTTYQRMFYDGRAGASSLSGFGMLHDGTGSTTLLPTVHPYVLDLLQTQQEFTDVTAFIRCFDTGTARSVGHSRTVSTTSRADSAVIADVALLEAAASITPQHTTLDCDLIVRGKLGGVARLFRWTGTAYQGETQAAGTLTRAALLAALAGDDRLTFMGVLPGAGARLSVDEDEDTVLNGDDPNPGIVDGPPKITQHPANVAVQPGGSVTLTVVAEGDSISYQWKRGTNNVGGNSPSFTIPVAATTDSGSYTVVVSNPFGSRTSNAAAVNVVPPPVITKQPLGRLVNEGATATFSVTATGNNLSYQWRRGSTPVQGGTKATLTLGGIGAQEAGDYTVVVSNGATSVTSDVATLNVNLLPVLAELNPPPAIIGQDYQWQISAANSPTKFTITGLPAGLKLNAATGQVTGRPSLAKTFAIKASASNSAGTSAAKTANMVVAPFPESALGVYTGVVPRHAEAALNNNLGGRLAITTTKLGAFTGSLVMGTATHALKGSLVMLPDTDPAGGVTITRKGLPALVLSFTLSRAGRSLSGTLTDGTHTLPLAAVLPEDQVAVFTGPYTFAFKHNDGGDTPQGFSVGALNISAKGAVTGTLKLADGTPAIPLAGTLGEGGSLPVFAVLYSKLGSLHGTLTMNAQAGGTLSGSSVSWFKHPQAKTRSYAAGFGPLQLSTLGGRYAIPAVNTLPMGLAPGPGNAQLLFTGGDAPDPAARLNWTAFEIQKGSPAKILPPAATANPGQVKLTLTPGSGVVFSTTTTGAFNGSFTLTDPDTSVTPSKPLKRLATFTGMIVDDGTGPRGLGFFNLAEMPSAGPPKTTAATTRLLSGAVELRPAPAP